MIKNLIRARESYNQELKKFLTFLLPEYEKNCLSEYVGYDKEKYIFGNQNYKELKQILNKINDFMEKN